MNEICLVRCTRTSISVFRGGRDRLLSLIPNRPHGYFFVRLPSTAFEQPKAVVRLAALEIIKGRAVKLRRSSEIQIVQGSNSLHEEARSKGAQSVGIS
jgi:hypothetical protein